MNNCRVKKTENGNYVIFYKNELLYSDSSGKFKKATYGSFDEIPVRSYLIEFENLKDIPGLFDIAQEKEVREDMAIRNAYNLSKQVSRLDLGDIKIQLRSNGKLYRFLKQGGWSRKPMSELTHTAISARLTHRVPLDLESLDEDFAEQLKVKTREYLEIHAARDKRKKALIKDYERLLLSPIEPTIKNIAIVLAYLNTQNWGTWRLPRFNCGYSAHQYDCEGKTATTISLDKTISDKEYGVINTSKFSYGAPRGFLPKYLSVDRVY